MSVRKQLSGVEWRTWDIKRRGSLTLSTQMDTFTGTQNISFPKWTDLQHVVNKGVLSDEAAAWYSSISHDPEAPSTPPEPENTQSVVENRDWNSESDPDSNV